MDLKCEILDILIEDCLLKIFKLLTFEDLMNVAETCTKFKSVADSLFKKHSFFVLKHDPRRSARTEQTVLQNNMKRILKHTGHHVTSLEIRYYSDDFPVFDWIDCSKLKQLQMFDWKPSYENVFTSNSFDNLELFSSFCSFPNLNTVLAGLNKLKCLNIDPTEINVDDLKLILRNNTNLESFVVDANRRGFDFNCQLLQMIPKVQKLALCCEEGNISNVNSLPTFDHLTTLQLNCKKIDVSEFLGRLTQPTLLKELEVHCVSLNSLVSLLKVLGRFDNLELLHLDAVMGDNNEYSNFMAKSFLWPPSIKRLYLFNMPINRTICCSTIRQLKSLEQFDALFLLDTNNADIVFRNISKLLVGREQKLHLALPWCCNFSFGGKHSGVNINL